MQLPGVVQSHGSELCSFSTSGLPCAGARALDAPLFRRRLPRTHGEALKSTLRCRPLSSWSPLPSSLCRRCRRRCRCLCWMLSMWVVERRKAISWLVSTPLFSFQHPPSRVRDLDAGLTPRETPVLGPKNQLRLVVVCTLRRHFPEPIAGLQNWPALARSHATGIASFCVGHYWHGFWRQPVQFPQRGRRS